MIYIVNSNITTSNLMKSDLVSLFVKSNLKIKKVGGKKIWNAAINEIEASKQSNLFIYIAVEGDKTLIKGYTLCIRGVLVFLLRVFMNKIRFQNDKSSLIKIIPLIGGMRISKKSVIIDNKIPIGKLKLFLIWHFSLFWNRIQLIWIDESYRGKGVGELLYNKVLFFYSVHCPAKLLALVSRKNQSSLSLHARTFWTPLISDNKNILFQHFPSKNDFD